MKKIDVDLSLFRHNTPIQVRYKDIDMQGHANNATVLTYIEQGRVAYLDQLFPHHNFSQIGLIIARTEIDYIQPIFLQDKIICYTRISHIGNKSFIFENALINTEHQMKSIAKSVMVCFDYEKNHTIAVPEEWRLVISAFELQITT